MALDPVAPVKRPWLDRTRAAALGAVAVLLFAAVAVGDRETTVDTPTNDLRRLRAEAALMSCPPGLGVPIETPRLSCLDGSGDVVPSRAPGTPLVVNVWAYWCGPCQREIPLLVDLAERSADRFEVVGIASSPDAYRALAFTRDFGVRYSNVLDPDGEVLRSVGAGLPQTLFVSADGRVQHVERGEIRTEDELNELVRVHLHVPVADVNHEGDRHGLAATAGSRAVGPLANRDRVR